MSFATVIKKLLLILFLPPEQELLNVIDAEPQVQEMRVRLVHIPRCVVCAYPCVRVRGQPGPTSRGLDTGRVFKVPHRFCPESEAVVKERALSVCVGAVQFVCSNYNLLCSPHVPHELSVAVQIPLTLSHSPAAHCTLQKNHLAQF